MHFLARYCQIEEITCLTQNIIPGLPPTESCESTRDGGGGRRLQFVPDSECVSVADVGVGCILASHSFAWFSVFLAWAPQFSSGVKSARKTLSPRDYYSCPMCWNRVCDWHQNGQKLSEGWGRRLTSGWVMYRVTIQVVPKGVLTSKQRLHFSTWTLY